MKPMSDEATIALAKRIWDVMYGEVEGMVLYAWHGTEAMELAVAIDECPDTDPALLLRVLRSRRTNTMTDCNAKVTTADVTNEDMLDGSEFMEGEVWSNVIPDGATVQRQGDRLVRVDLHPLACGVNDDRHMDFHIFGRNTDQWTTWRDATPGAIPHEDDVSVSDAAIEAARDAIGEGWSRPGYEAMKHALLASKRAEREQA